MIFRSISSIDVIDKDFSANSEREEEKIVLLVCGSDKAMLYCTKYLFSVILLLKLIFAGKLLDILQNHR